MKRQKEDQDDNIPKKARTEIMCQENPGPSMLQIPNSTTDDSPSRKSIYEEFFQFNYENGVKYGNCIKCGKNSKGIWIVRYKMSGHNTSSLRTHLKNKHVESFNKLSTRKESDKPQGNRAKVNFANFFKVNNAALLNEKMCTSYV